MQRDILTNSEKLSISLIGGHIKDNESPDEAMRREMREEIGVTLETMVHFDYMQHPDGKILLLYMGTISEQSQFVLDKSEVRSVVWIDAHDLVSKKYDIGCYQQPLERVFSSTS